MANELSDEFFRVAMEAAPTGMLVIDRRGTIVLVNRELERLFGYSRAELVGKNLDMLLPERFRAGHVAQRAQYFRDPGVRSMGQGRELFGLRKDGTEIPVEVGLNPVSASDGDFVLSSISDVSERRRAAREREALMTQLAREEKFKAIFEHSPLAMAILDRDVRYAQINPAWTRVLGYETREIVGKTPADITPPEDRAHDQELVSALVRGEVQSYSCEKRYLRRDGSIVHVLLHAAAVPEPSGGHYYVGQVQDITARVRAEQALKSQERSLENERERFRTLVTHAPVGIFEMAVDGSVLYMNDQWLELTGLSAEEARSPAARLARMEPDDRERVLAVVAAARANGTNYRLEFRYRAKHGKLRRLSTVAAPIRGQGGVPTAFIGVTIDATAELDAADAVQRSLREKETLLKEIHHRVKNNLQVIGSIIGLQANRQKDQGARVVFDELRGRIHAIAQLHERLYRSPDLAAIDLGEYLEALATDAVRTAGAGLGRLRVRRPRSLTVLGLDEAVPMGLILNELVTNAVKHGARDGNVEVELALEDGSLRLTVTDDGPGFSAGFRPEDKQTLGMLLVKNLTHNLRGEIAFCSQPTRVTLTVPLGSKGGTNDASAGR